MPWNLWTYTEPAAATDAVAGKVIASADWNAIFTDNQTAFNQLAGAYINSIGVVFSVTGAASIPIILPTGFTQYAIDSVIISGANTSLTTAKVALFTAAGGTGTQIISSTGVTAATAGVIQKIIPTSASSFAYGSSVSPLFFTVMVVASLSATANVTMHIVPLP
jgi:hypothetical protein